MFLDILEEMKEWQYLAAYWKDTQQQAEAKLKERFKQDSAQAEAQAEWYAHRADVTGMSMPIRSDTQLPLEEQLKALREDYKARREEDRQNSLAKCQRLLSAGKDALSAIYMQDTPQGLLDDLGVIRVKEGTISDEELGMYLDKYAANWPAYTAVLQLAHSMGRLASVQAPDYAQSLASIGDGVNKYYQQEEPAETDKALQEDGALASMMADLDSFISAQEAQEGVTTA